MQDSIYIFKGIAIMAVLAAAYIAAVFSAKLAVLKSRDRIFSLGSALAGGIFLGTGMLHMLPDAHEGVKLLTSSQSLPWVALFTCCGFLLIFFVRRVLMYEEKALEDTVEKKSGKRFSPRILILSLSIHSLIAGVAFGAEEIFRKAAILLMAILAYKLSAIFALEVNLHRSGLHKQPGYRKLNSIFSFITPIGIMMGLALTAILSARTEQIVATALDSLTAGSFLYIALSDILEEEFMAPKDRFFKFALVTLGFAVMAIITLQV